MNGTAIAMLTSAERAHGGPYLERESFMVTAERSLGNKAAAEADLAELARSLAVLTGIAKDYPNAVLRLSRGLDELSLLARNCGLRRASMNARALSAYFKGCDSAPETDAPFVLDRVARFLASLQSGDAAPALEGIA
jgi:hypothetical protein